VTRLLVTGAAGLLGSAVARAARTAGLEVTAHSGRADADLLDAAEAANLVATTMPDAIVNAAGRTHGPPAALWRDNLVMVVRLLDAVASTAPSTRIVLLGSAAEYGLTGPGIRLGEDAPCAPNSEYGMSKLAGTRIAGADDRVETCVARLFNIVSEPHPARSLLGRVERAYREGEANPDGSGEVRDFMPIDDAARALVALATVRSAPPVVNVCTGVPRTAAAQLGREPGGAPGHWSVGDPARLAATMADLS
jgi:nucleoside-diphosphate-sugar epimerase